MIIRAPLPWLGVAAPVQLGLICLPFRPAPALTPAALATGSPTHYVPRAAAAAAIQRGKLVSYSVKEIFKTLQGEGRHSGRPAVFCRFAGCNLWSGREQDREAAVCSFCDTDFVGTDGVGGGKFGSAEALAGAIVEVWGDQRERRYVVLTGGEPLLQVDGALIDALHSEGFAVAVETNGTLEAPAGIDWVCVSPKAGAPLVQTSGDELKLVYPQAGLEPERLEGLDFAHRWLQPMDGPELAGNTKAAVEYCLANPKWRLSLQTHKLIGIP